MRSSPRPFFSLSTPTPIGGCLDSERLSLCSPADTLAILIHRVPGIFTLRLLSSIQTRSFITGIYFERFLCRLRRLNSDDNDHACFRYLPEG